MKQTLTVFLLLCFWLLAVPPIATGIFLSVYFSLAWTQQHEIAIMSASLLAAIAVVYFWLLPELELRPKPGFFE